MAPIWKQCRFRFNMRRQHTIFHPTTFCRKVWNYFAATFHRKTIWFYHIIKSKSTQIYSVFTDRKGKVMFSQVFVCPQSASLLLVHCWSLLWRGRYASYWNAFLFHRQCAKYLENISKRPFRMKGFFSVCLDTISSAVINWRIYINLSIWRSNPRFNLPGWKSTCFEKILKFFPTRMHSSRMRTARTSPYGGSLSGRPPPYSQTETPPVNRMTHRCKNITLSATSFADDKNAACLGQLICKS